MISAKERIARVAQYEDAAGPWTVNDEPDQILADIHAVDPDSKLTPEDVETYYSQLPGHYAEVDESEAAPDYKMNDWD